MSARLANFDQKRTELSPGTVLVREWDRRPQRVMVLADGFAWNGQTYDSLSKVTLFAILANNLQQSWRFDWGPPKAVLRDVWTIIWIVGC
jgi:hypothetical protein